MSLRKVARVALWVLAAITVAVWWFLLGGLCDAPIKPVVATNNVVPYNCHGKTVFLTGLQDTVRLWLPCVWILVLFGLHLLKEHQDAKPV